MRIGMISQWYEPEPGSAAHPTAIARALRDRGHDVRVLTAFPSYPRGRIYDGWSMSLRKQELREGIQILRVPDVPSHDHSAMRRAASLTSFALSATAQVGWLRGADVCLTYLTPATVGLASVALQTMWGVPYVLSVQDLWPETVSASGFIGSERFQQRVNGLISRLLERLYRRASAVLALSPTMRDTLAARGAGDRADVVYNWVDESVFQPAQPRGELDQDKTWIMYAGGIGDVQGLDSAVRAIARLKSRPDIRLAFVGDGVARTGLESLTQELGVDRQVAFLGARPLAEMPTVMADAQAQLISLRDLPLFRGTVPSKLQAAMACGQPVVCSVAGDAGELVRRSGAGYAVDPENPAQLASAFERIADDVSTGAAPRMGERALEFYRSQFSSDVGASLLESHLIRALKRRSAA